MTIGNTRFWIDGWMLRSSNRANHDQPFEMGICKRWRMPGIKVYEDESESGGTQVRLSIELLWFWVNALLFHTNKQTVRWDDSGRNWGFYFMDRWNFVWRWGKQYVSFDLPFLTRVFVKHEILSIDRRKVVHVYGRGVEDFGVAEEVKGKHSATFPYRYECLNGSTQNVQATVVVERWTRRWKWTPIKSVAENIWVTFSEEVGPQRGSWKGGVTGCGWDLKPKETVVQCLRRMESERRFDR